MKAYAAQQSRSPAERDRLISEHVEVARRISLRIARRCPDWIAREDLMGAALLGLTEAANRYDASRNEPFLAFAEKRIRGAVLDELRRGDIMPRRARAMARKIGVIIRDLERTGATVTDEAVAQALGVTVEDYRNNLEQLVHAVLVASGRPALASPARGGAWEQALLELSPIAERTYRALVHETPELVRYLQAATTAGIPDRLRGEVNEMNFALARMMSARFPRSNTTRFPLSLVGSITLASASLVSMSLMRPSTKPCFSLAAS